jgi:cyclic dehypoxanthinyl futalosine synthase
VELKNAGSTRGIEEIEALLTGIRRRYPHVWVHGFSAPEVLAIADQCGLGLRETLARLHAAGLDSMNGDGVDLVATRATGSCDATGWLKVHRTAHELAMPTAAGMIFGAGETPEQRVDFLEAVRELQEETGGFTAFVPVGYEHPQRELDGVTAVERLKTLAISRMVLENIDNIQASATGQGLKVLQMSLRFGGNDAGAAGLGTEAASEEDLRRIIRDAGFKPVARDATYRTMFLN